MFCGPLVTTSCHHTRMPMNNARSVLQHLLTHIHLGTCLPSADGGACMCHVCNASQADNFHVLHLTPMCHLLLHIQASLCAPSIIFLDELDALAPARSVRENTQVH